MCTTRETGFTNLCTRVCGCTCVEWESIKQKIYGEEGSSEGSEMEVREVDTLWSYEA